MLSFSIKPGDKLIKGYYEVLGQMTQLHIDHEMAVRSAFQSVLAGYSRKLEWTLVPEYQIKARSGRISVDAALLDTWKQRRGFWEAKDEHDSLEKEIKKKIERGYPTNNIIFQAPERAILYQNGVRQGLDEDIRDAKSLVELLHHFFEYREPDHEEWDSAVAEFKERIPELATRAKEIIDGEHKSNRDFREAFDAFYRLCQQAINPNLTKDAVEKMLVQHLLTERIFRRVFHAEEFRSRNIIAAEIEKVITSMTSHHFSREQFLSDLDRFYKVLERAADSKEDYSEKQAFLNTVYERFFQGYSPKEADTHGIVYTPQPIVDFMVRSVEDILKKEFGRSLADKNVHILDPFVGTGNFITRVMRQIAETDKGALPYKYDNELHCNEVMLLPYYIASMNIEHEYLEQIGEYKPFDGICLVDTFELAEPEQGGLEFMTEENTERVKKQKKAPIFVIIGNPPYNARELDENDNNKNRKYKVIDGLVSDTYARGSSASNKNALSDAYVKAICWAAQRLTGDGIIAFVSNNSFLDGTAFDGMRRALLEQFSTIYHLNLKGDARTTGEQRRQQAGNIFENAIRVRVGITLLVRRHNAAESEVKVASIGDYAGATEKAAFLQTHQSIKNVDLRRVPAHGGRPWTGEYCDAFADYIAIGDKDAKGDEGAHSVFREFGGGVKTNRDVWAYNMSADVLAENMRHTIDCYNDEVARWARSDRKTPIDDFVKYDDLKLSWSRDLKLDVMRGKFIEFSTTNIRSSLYRPFTRSYLYFDRTFNEEIYLTPRMFPSAATEAENIGIAATVDPQIEFSVQTVACLPCLHVGGRPSQVFTFYTYSEDGSNRRENITDWALEQFRSHYRDRAISKWDIFHYVYAVLHHPEYRSRYAANLKRELPRIPFLAMAGAESREGRQNVARHVSAGEAAPTASESRRDGTTAPQERRYKRLSDEAKRNVLSEVKALQDEGTMQHASQDNAGVFRAFAKAGKRFAEIHVHYEQQPEFKLEKIWKQGAKLDYCVTKMRLSKDKSTLLYNDALTLKGIPPSVYEYRLGNRSALEWFIDQYQVFTDNRSGITNDPNRADDEQYILRLIGQVITVSIETVEIVNSLPEFILADSVKATNA
jgi:predicted helicase